MSTYTADRAWSDTKMQPIAIRDHYRTLWPGCEVRELDKGKPGSLDYMLDIAGADKMLRMDGIVAFLGQRFRRNTQRRFDDFTLRWHRESGMKTEYAKTIEAAEKRGMIAGYYSYGLANADDSGFERMRIIDYRAFLLSHIDGALPPHGVRPNNDTPKTWFAYWPFSVLKQFIIHEWVNEPMPVNYAPEGWPWAKWIGHPGPGPCPGCTARDYYHYPKDNARFVCRNCHRFYDEQQTTA